MLLNELNIMNELKKKMKNTNINMTNKINSLKNELEKLKYKLNKRDDEYLILLQDFYDLKHQFYNRL